MEHEKSIKKQPSMIQVTPDNQSTICCPACGNIRTKDVTLLRDIGGSSTFRCRCRCGNVFKCRLDYRQFYRKPVRIAGEYIQVKSGKRGEILIEDLSLGGVGFSNFTPHRLHNEDVLELRFRLRGAQQKNLRMRCTVRNIRDGFVGAQFNPSESTEQDLRYYLAS